MHMYIPFYIPGTTTITATAKCVHCASGDPCVGMGDIQRQREREATKTDDESVWQLRGWKGKMLDDDLPRDEIGRCCNTR